MVVCGGGVVLIVVLLLTGSVRMNLQQATVLATRVRKHVQREIHEVYQGGQLVYKRTKVDTDFQIEHLAAIIKQKVDCAVNKIVAKIDQQNVFIHLAPGLTFLPEVPWQEEISRHAAELEHEMENLRADFHVPPAAGVNSVGDELQRLIVLEWLDSIKSRAQRYKAMLFTFADCALQVHNNLIAHAKLHELDDRTKNFTKTMLQGLADLDAYRKLYHQTLKTAVSKREFTDEFGCLAEVELVAKAIGQPCASCRADRAYPWALFRNKDTFALLCDVHSRDDGERAWVAMQDFMCGDYASALDVLRSQHVVAGGAVEGPVSLLRLQEEAPAHFKLWSRDANMLYWAELHTNEGSLFLPTAVAFRFWPDLRSPAVDIIRLGVTARIESEFEERCKGEPQCIMGEE